MSPRGARSPRPADVRREVTSAAMIVKMPVVGKPSDANRKYELAFTGCRGPERPTPLTLRAIGAGPEAPRLRGALVDADAISDGAAPARRCRLSSVFLPSASACCRAT